MRNLIVITLLFIFPILLFSQDSNEIKIFKGKYVENAEDCIYKDDYYTYEKGNSTYQYYENEESERIFDGFFKITEKDLKIDGQYSDDMKTGVWKIISDRSDGSDKFRLETSAEYLDGKLNGNCSAKEVNIKTKNVVFTSTATFKNNIMVGKFLFKQDLIGMYGSKSKIDINFNFDSNGLYDGDYIIKFTVGDVSYEDKRKYQNGVLQSQIYRNLNNGNILGKYDPENTKVSKPIGTYDYKTELIWDLQSAFIYWTIGSVSGNEQTGKSSIYIVQRGIDQEGLNSPENNN